MLRTLFVQEVRTQAPRNAAVLGVDMTTGDLTTRIMWPEFLEAVRTGVDPTVVGAGSVLVGPLLAAVLVWWAVRAIERHNCLR
ncbi:MAG: hypothetical protein Q4C85_07970 [Actinomyces sp.]|uniref:hypothetical protein n=1 Tax=Actinomyces sp. TaxID=29317 RepID=UPI0026DCCFE4|nr:hypothetical protein [Actinomyces sp.]MDO4243679.1 hypothetical protein [Actinomyces sp.]